MMITTTMLRRCVVLTVGGLTVAGSTIGLGTATARAAEVGLEAAMHATATYPNAHGHVGYERDAAGRELDLSLAGLRSLAAHRVTVRVHGHVAARPAVGSRGRIHVHRHEGVPRMRAGDVVRVRTTSGTLICAGTLHRDRED